MSTPNPLAQTQHTGLEALRVPLTGQLPPLVTELPAQRFAPIQWVVLDCDGVLTDGRVWVDEQGNERKAFSVIDGHGTALLRELGLRLAMITRGPQGISTARATKLRFDRIYTSILDKGASLQALQQELQLPPEAFAYMGDDLPDLAAFAHAGLCLAPATARTHVLQAADARTSAHAGHGAVREVCDAFVLARRP